MATTATPTQASETDRLEWQIFDADSHYYETEDAFVGHLSDEHRDRADRLLTAGGMGRLTDAVREVGAPGSMTRNLRKMATGAIDVADTPRRSPAFNSEKTSIRPEYIERAARLEVLDSHDVEGSVLFPSRANMLEFYLEGDVDTTYATFRAFNEWLDETWGFSRDGRLYAAAQLSMIDPERSIAELDRLLAKGLRVLNLRPGPFGRRSPADPAFHPFWARVEEAGVLACFHASNTFGYLPKFYEGFWDPDGFGSSFMYVVAGSDRQIMDTLAALVMHNLFGHFPKLKVASIEHGAYWVPYLLKIMDKAHAFYRFGPALGGRLEEKPSALFKRHVWVAPFHEEDCLATVSLLGPDHVLLGSDFPHSEGTETPQEMLGRFDGLAEQDLRKVAHDNIHRLLAA
ncbi:MAG: amidohydrolase [Acidimicrobiales bacterium]|nr:amidohydrolase [Acidimicrobiales bacterium]